MIFTTFLNIAIFQGIILGVIILKSPFFKTPANKYLAYAIFTLSILLLNLVFEIIEAYNAFPFLRFIDNIEWIFIFPVFILLFIVKQINDPIKNSRNLLWLFIPFGYSLTINVFNDFDAVFGSYHISDSGIAVLDILNSIQLFLALTFIPGVLIYSSTFIKFLKNKQERQWVTSLWILVFIFLFSWVLAIFVALFFTYDINFLMKLIALFATFLIHWTAYRGIYKFKLARDKEGINVLLNNGVLIPNQNLSTDTKTKVENNKDFFMRDNLYFTKLEVLCKDKQLYRDSTLNREKVAEKLEISTGYLSQIINTVTGENFTIYINNYRIEAVKEMILNPEFDKYSLLAIGIEAGFNSKTTFYKAFKKITGMTPNAFSKIHK